MFCDIAPDESGIQFSLRRSNRLEHVLTLLFLRHSEGVVPRSARGRGPKQTLGHDPVGRPQRRSVPVASLTPPVRTPRSHHALQGAQSRPRLTHPPMQIARSSIGARRVSQLPVVERYPWLLPQRQSMSERTDYLTLCQLRLGIAGHQIAQSMQYVEVLEEDSVDRFGNRHLHVVLTGEGDQGLGRRNALGDAVH
jgi:hypothetical protein